MRLQVSSFSYVFLSILPLSLSAPIASAKQFEEYSAPVSNALNTLEPRLETEEPKALYKKPKKRKNPGYTGIKTASFTATVVVSGWQVRKLSPQLSLLQENDRQNHPGRYIIFIDGEIYWSELNVDERVKVDHSIRDGNVELYVDEQSCVRHLHYIVDSCADEGLGGEATIYINGDDMRRLVITIDPNAE